MINNIISIPVHERAEVVIDQICNYKFFCPNCGIVLHISNGFNWKDSFLKEEEFLSILSTFENVFVNPTRLNTALGDIVHVHLSNFEYVSKVAEFEYFSMEASNDLFVRKMPPISNCDANFGNAVFEEMPNWFWYKSTIQDEYLYKILNYLGATIPDVRSSQIEGSFYRKELFREIVDVVNAVYKYEEVYNKRRIIYPREEIYYPTVAYILSKGKSLKIIQPNYVRVFWNNKDYLPTTEQITDIAQGKMPGIYGVKRVLRTIDDPARVYIGTQIGNYREQTLNLIRGKERKVSPMINMFTYYRGMMNFLGDPIRFINS